MVFMAIQPENTDVLTKKEFVDSFVADAEVPSMRVRRALPRYH